MEFKDVKARGIRFLLRNQLPSGEFKTVISENRSFADAKPMSNVFTTAVILHALRSIKDEPCVQDAAGKAVRWLETQLDPTGLWVFFGKPMRTWLAEEQIPPDIDCNAHIASAFMDWGVDFPYNAFARKLIKYQGKNKPLGTWIYGTDLDWHPSIEMFIDRQGVDPVVNANAACLFYQLGMAMPAIEEYLENQIAGGKFDRPSSFYYSPVIFIYAISKLVFFRPQFMVGEADESCQKVLSSFISETDLSKVTPLEKAMAVSAGIKGLIPFSQIRVDNAMVSLKELQAEDGGWNPYPFHSTYSVHYGSRELTTALIVEAMALREKSSHILP